MKEKPESKRIITEKEYKQLKYDAKLLSCLKAVGIHKWDGYDDAIKMMGDRDKGGI